MRFTRRALALVVSAGLIVGIPAVAQAALTPQERAAAAAGFISSKQKLNGSIPAFSTIGSTSDAVIALVAAERGPINIKKALNFLSKRVAAGDVDGNIGLQAKVVLAAVAGSKNPHTFGGENLPALIAGTEQGTGQYGAGTAVFDDAMAMLALEAAGQDPSANARQFLLDAQCDDGGWAYDAGPQVGDDSHCFSGDYNTDYFQSDTNTTSYVLMALASDNGNGDPVVDPFDFFTAIRDSVHHGWGYTWGFNTTDANSTSLVIQAYTASGVTLPSGALNALKSLQYKGCGGFAFTWAGSDLTDPDIGATIGAVPGLVKVPLPLEPAKVTKPAPAPIGCP